MAITRQVIKARDIQNFFGKREHQSFKMMADMKAYFAKKSFQPITIGDFCEYYGVKPDDLKSPMSATDEWENLNATKRKSNNNSNLAKLDSALDTVTTTFGRQQKPSTAYVFSKK